MENKWIKIDEYDEQKHGLLVDVWSHGNRFINCHKFDGEWYDESSARLHKPDFFMLPPLPPEGQPKQDAARCGECEQIISANEATAVYDGEICHIDCAADRMDEADFESWRSGCD